MGKQEFRGSDEEGTGGEGPHAAASLQQVAAHQPDPLVPGREEAPAEPNLKAAPSRLKALVGRGHPEFSSGRQQDACEYFQHLLSLLERAEHAGSQRLPPASQATPLCYQFAIEDRIKCMASLPFFHLLFQPLTL